MFPDTVKVIDSGSAGMVMGASAMRASGATVTRPGLSTSPTTETTRELGAEAEEPAAAQAAAAPETPIPPVARPNETADSDEAGAQRLAQMLDNSAEA